MTIDILVPVLGRPQNAQPLVDSIAAATKNDYRILFLCSPDDDHQTDACQETGAEVIICDFPPGDADYPKKMNVGYQETDAPWLLLAADDLEFDPGWDEIALNNAEHFGVVGTNDCLNKNFQDGSNSTHPLVRRSYVDVFGGSADGPGVLIHEGYDHNFCERELCGLAQDRDLYTYVPESKLRHRHPAHNTTEWDDTYRKGTRHFARDQQLFFRRAWRWNYRGLNKNEQRVARRFRNKK